MCFRMLFSDLIAEVRGKQGSKWFSKNSRELFKELLSTCDDNFNPIHIFSGEELEKATNNYSEQQIIAQDFGFKLYRGVLPHRSILVKKFKDQEEYFGLPPIKEITFSSVFSSHRSVLKLLGCCLDTKCPILVFEDAENGTLADNISSLTWTCRKKIVVDLCDAVSYLHNKFRNPIVHRDIKATSILLDRDNSAKLINFSLSLAIPDGEVEAEDQLKGTFGYIAPEYMMTNRFNEKIDVFSIGVVMLELVTGQRVHDFYRLPYKGDDVDLVDFVRRHIQEERFDDIIDPAIRDEGLWSRNWDFQEFAEIALTCMSAVEERPTIGHVAAQLRAALVIDATI